MDRRPVKQILLRLHSIVGLAAALVLACAGLTGALMSFEDEVITLLNRRIVQVPVREAARLTPDALAGRVEAETGAKVDALTLSGDGASAVRVRFARDASGARRDAVHVDPYDGRILGAVAGEAAFATIRRLHRFLLLPGDGDGLGRRITGAAALGLPVLLVSGLVLRWPRRPGRLPAWYRIHLSARGRGLYRSLHGVIGTWLIPVYLVIALSGLWWSYGWYREGATWLFTGAASARKAPARDVKPDRGAERSGSKPPQPAVTLDRAWDVFLSRYGTDYGKATLIVPSRKDAGMVRIRLIANDAPSEAVRDEIRIDTAGGRIVSVERYADKTAGQIVLARVLDIHTGRMFGPGGRIVFMLGAATMPLFMVTGILLYLSRRRLWRLARADGVDAASAEHAARTRAPQGSLS